MFDALLDRKRIADRQAYVRAGIIAAAVVNFSMGAPEKPVNELDFVPDYLREKDKEEDFDLRRLTPEQQAAYVLNQFTKRTYQKKV